LTYCRNGVYTDEEIETLFTLLSKLYAGIENLDKRVSKAKKTGEPDI